MSYTQEDVTIYDEDGYMVCTSRWIGCAAGYPVKDAGGLNLCLLLLYFPCQRANAGGQGVEPRPHLVIAPL